MNKTNIIERLKNNIINAANLLLSKADSIVEDIDVDRVTNLFITLNLDRDESSTLDIEKSYLVE